MSQIVIEVVCDFCHGVGLIHPVHAPKGVWVVCYGGCEGSGKKPLLVTRFFERERIDGVEKVVLTLTPLEEPGKNADLTGAISYEEFLAGKMPKT
jgi:hypothetical protein